VKLLGPLAGLLTHPDHAFRFPKLAALVIPSSRSIVTSRICSQAEFMQSITRSGQTPFQSKGLMDVLGRKRSRQWVDNPQT